ncbi:MAG: prokaryotic cytochrome b561 [Firmicutes bacterium]|nr:prokaryotic cytochrome b561 [Bacillota bacterium]
MARDSTEKRILKHPLASRIFHWCLIMGFLPAAISGFILWLKVGGDGIRHVALEIHMMGATVFTVSVIGYMILRFTRVLAYVHRIFSWNKNDLGWFKVLGGYPQKILFGKNVEVPPMGKINSGQKILSIVLFFGGPILIITGWILYAYIPVLPKIFIFWVDVVHLILGVLCGLFIIGHIFLGVYNWSDFKVMFGDGVIDFAEANEHTPVWVKNEVEPVNHQPLSNLKVVEK